ncbi:MAG TPA: cytochrome c [Candidatus Eisenbacteria bacterium]|jgi:mono/diheme cytochrome c family protein
MPRLSPLMVLILSAALLAGCGGNKPESEPPATPSTSSPGTTAVPAVSPYDAGPRAAESPVDGALAGKGEKLFQTKGCVACHGFGKKITGPDLDGVTTRRTAQWMENQILHPEVMTKQDPIARDLLRKYSVQMPNQKLTPEEARAVIEYLKKKNKEKSTAAN